VSAGAYVRVPGNVVNDGTSTINNDGNIFLTGNFTNNANVVSGNNSNVKLEGAAQNIDGLNSTTFGNLIIDGSADKTINIQTKINNTLAFNANHIIVGNFNLVLMQNAGISGALNNKYIVTNGTGSLVRKNLPLSGDSLFPVGNAVASYKPVVLNYTGVRDTFAVRVEAGVNPTTNVDPTCVQYTYIVEESLNGGTNATMLLGWNTVDEGVSFNRLQSVMWQHANGAWISLPGVPGAASNLPATNWDYQTSGITDFSANSNRFIVSSSQQVAVIDSPIDTAVCSGNNVIFTVAATGIPAASYQWQINCGAGWSDLANSSFYSGVTNDTLFVSGPDITINGCQYQCVVSNGISTDTSAYATLFVWDYLVVGVNVTQTPAGVICPGTNVTFDATAANGGTTPVYQWLLNGTNVGTNSSTYSNNTLSTGDIVSCIVVSSALCNTGPGSSNQDTIILDSLPVATINPGPVYFCEGSWVPLSTTQSTGFDYQWYLNGSAIPGDTVSTINASLPGIYSVIVSNNCGIDTALVTVNEIFYPVSTISATDPLSFCQGDSAVLLASADSGYTYQWQYNGSNISGATNSSYAAQLAGNYTLVVTNSCATQPSVPVTVTIYYPPTALITAIGPVNFCSGESVTFISSVDTNFTYQWQLDGTNIPGATTSTYTANQEGAYSVITSNPCGVDTSSQISVNIYQSPTVEAGDSVTIFAGSSTTFDPTASGGTSPYTYSWTPFSSLDNPFVSNPVASPIETTTYTVVLSDANGCISTDTLTVYVEYDIDIYLPTGFSPNGDNENDVLYVRGHGIKYLDLIIYDRWGEKIFETDDQLNGWDGTYKGKKLDPGVFVYYLKIVSYSGEEVIKKGNITLVR
jgi:gliding motility-associated-like protein